MQKDDTPIEVQPLTGEFLGERCLRLLACLLKPGRQKLFAASAGGELMRD
jgi:hypothetical protein